MSPLGVGRDKEGTRGFEDMGPSTPRRDLNRACRPDAPRENCILWFSWSTKYERAETQHLPVHEDPR